MFAVFVLCLVVTVFVWLEEGPLWGKLAVTAMCLALLPLLSVRGRIAVDDHELVLAVGSLFRKRLPLPDITSVELTRVAPMDFGGYGYRPLGGGDAAFVFQAGPAAKVTLRDGRSFVVAAPDADRLVDILRERAHLGGGETADDVL